MPRPQHKEIFIFRHGETDWNREGRFQGHQDIPINELGREQARSLIDPIRESGIQAILSSDLSRAYETARIIANRLGLPMFVHRGLREAHLGQAEGLVRKEIERRFGAPLVERWKSVLPTDADICYPGGETGAEIIERVFSALHGFLQDQPYHRIGISTHGGVIRRVMQRILPPGSEPVPIPNGVLYRLRYEIKTQHWTLEKPL